MAAAIRKDHAVPAPHPAEFRRRAVELARQGSKPIAEVAKDLGIMIYPLVRELADDDIDIAVTCRVLEVSRSGY